MGQHWATYLSVAASSPSSFLLHTDTYPSLRYLEFANFVRDNTYPKPSREWALPSLTDSTVSHTNRTTDMRSCTPIQYQAISMLRESGYVCNNKWLAKPDILERRYGYLQKIRHGQCGAVLIERAISKSKVLTGMYIT